MALPHDAFPADEELVVDPEAVIDDGEGGKTSGVVCVVGKGRFESKETGWGWEEHFIYKLSGFDEDGRVTHWVGRHVYRCGLDCTNELYRRYGRIR
jgi:hypothetical protein